MRNTPEPFVKISSLENNYIAKVQFYLMGIVTLMHERFTSFTYRGTAPVFGEGEDVERLKTILA